MGGTMRQKEKTVIWTPKLRKTFRLPAIRACIFDLDGLLINSEDIITKALNQLLEKYERPTFTPSIRSKLMGVHDSSNGDVFHEWAQLPIPREQWGRESRAHMELLFRDCEPLPGAEKLLSNLSSARSSSSGCKVELALASSTTSEIYALKTSRPETERLLGFFQPERRIFGDDPRLLKGRRKPAPDLYLLALDVLNSTVGPGEEPIKANECLVFEDSAVGVEAGRRAGMRVVWVPHPDVAVEYKARQKDILAGRTGLFDAGDEQQPGQIDDGWAESIPSLEHFYYDSYGISVLS